MADRITVGSVEILGLLDLIPPPYDPQQFFPATTPDAWEPYRSDHLECGHVQLYFGCFALRSQGQVLMVDTGMGPGPHPTRGNRTGNLLAQLKLQGIDPEDVATVVHTHLHSDHIGWNITYEDGRPRLTFPKATHLVPRADWEYFTTPEVLDSPRALYVRDQVLPLESMGAMELIEGDHTITPEIGTVPTPGHTPGHVNVIINSQGQRGVVVGDMLHSPVQVQQPDWYCWADTDPELGTRSRKAMLDRFESEGFIVAACHFKPDEHFGKIIKMEGRRYWQVL